MATISIGVSSEQLLRAVERLPAEELSAFAAQVNALRAQRLAPQLSREETVVRWPRMTAASKNTARTDPLASDRCT